MVLTDVRHHPETQMVAGMIEDETDGLAFGSAQAATDSLDEGGSAPCRPSVDDATDHRQADAGREDADVANDLRRPGAEPIEDALTVRPIGKGVHVLGRDAGLDEALRDMLRMPTIYAIDERRPSLAEPEPGLDNIAGDDRPIHRVGKLAFVEITCDGTHAGEIRFARSKGDERRQIPIADQTRGGRGYDQIVVVFAETARPRRRR